MQIGGVFKEVPNHVGVLVAAQGTAISGNCSFPSACEPYSFKSPEGGFDHSSILLWFSSLLAH